MDSLDKRVAACAEIVNASEDTFIVWCDLNAESDMLKKSIPGDLRTHLMVWNYP